VSSGIVLVARGPIVPAYGQTALERADPSGREIAPNVPPRVLNAQHNVPPYVRNAPPQAGRPTSSAGRQARNTVITTTIQTHRPPQRHQSGARPQQSARQQQQARPGQHHARPRQGGGGGARSSARSVRNLNRTRPNNNPV